MALSVSWAGPANDRHAYRWPLSLGTVLDLYVGTDRGGCSPRQAERAGLALVWNTLDPRTSVRVQKPLLPGQSDGLGSIARPDSREDRAHMELHRALSDPELRSDLRILEPLGDV